MAGKEYTYATATRGGVSTKITFFKAAPGDTRVYECPPDSVVRNWEPTVGRSWKNEKNARRFLTDSGWKLS